MESRHTNTIDTKPKKAGKLHKGKYRQNDTFLHWPHSTDEQEAGREVFAPRLDVHEDFDKINVDIELPGIPKDAIKVRLESTYFNFISNSNIFRGRLSFRTAC